MFLSSTVLLFACCGVDTKKASPASYEEVTLFFTTELRGTLEPCGCNSDPLGDLSRLATVLADARKAHPTAWLDGGSTLYTDPTISAAQRPEAGLKAQFLAQKLPGLGLAAAAIGPNDLAMGQDGVLFARQAANLPGGHAPRVLELGRARVGVFGVIDPELVANASDPNQAARKAIDTLHSQGAQVIVALAHMTRAKARKLAKDVSGIDVLLVGHDAPEQGVPMPEGVGSTVLVQPGNRGQVVAKLTLGIRGGRLTDAIGEERATQMADERQKKIASRENELATWAKDPSADPTFVAKKREEMAAWVTDVQSLRDKPLRVPAQGSWFTLEMVPIKRKLACDPEIAAAKAALDDAVGKANLAAAADEKPTPASAGQASYVGMEECGYCHKTAVDFWKTTHHARAWETLENVHKQWSRDCIGCHVTGWLAPGGSTLTANEPLRNVQCEVCHGPGSLHVNADGKEQPRSLTRSPEPNRCLLTCHTPEHSDTFEFQAYLRDVTGKGHGEAVREKLGVGPTGHELRSTALAKAGQDVGAGCPK